MRLRKRWKGRSICKKKNVRTSGGMKVSVLLGEQRRVWHEDDRNRKHNMNNRTWTARGLWQQISARFRSLQVPDLSNMTSRWCFLSNTSRPFPCRIYTETLHHALLPVLHLPVFNMLMSLIISQFYTGQFFYSLQPVWNEEVGVGTITTIRS